MLLMIQPVWGQDELPGVILGEQVAQWTFTEATQWPAQISGEGWMQVEGGKYQISIPTEQPQTMTSLNGGRYADIVIEAEISQRDWEASGSSGVMCRASDNGTGYVFLLAGGTGFIARLADGVLTPLTGLGSYPTTGSDTLGAACIENRLTLYVNGLLVVETSNADFSEGAVGIVAALAPGTSNPLVATVDDMRVYAAQRDPDAQAQTPVISEPSVNLPRLPEVNIGSELLYERFDTPDSWETIEHPYALLRVNEGIYQGLVNDYGFAWGLSEETYSDTIVQVETRQFSVLQNNAYGVICRANPDRSGQGYFFFVSSDGYFSVFKNLEPGGNTLVPLQTWTASPLIRQGRALNTLTVVCVENLLALYINGENVVSIEDTSYSSGHIGMVVASLEDGETEIGFDSLAVYDAWLVESAAAP